MNYLKEQFRFLIDASLRKDFFLSLFKFFFVIFAIQLLVMVLVTPFVAKSDYFKKASEEIRASETLISAIGQIKEIDTPFWNCSYSKEGSNAFSRCEIHVTGERKYAKVKSFLKDEGNGWELVRAYAELSDYEVVILKQ